MALSDKNFEIIQKTINEVAALKTEFRESKANYVRLNNTVNDMFTTMISMAMASTQLEKATAFKIFLDEHPVIVAHYDNNSIQKMPDTIKELCEFSKL